MFLLIPNYATLLLQWINTCHILRNLFWWILDCADRLDLSLLVVKLYCCVALSNYFLALTCTFSFIFTDRRQPHLVFFQQALFPMVALTALVCCLTTNVLSVYSGGKLSDNSLVTGHQISAIVSWRNTMRYNKWVSLAFPFNPQLYQSLSTYIYTFAEYSTGKWSVLACCLLVR